MGEFYLKCMYYKVFCMRVYILQGYVDFCLCACVYICVNVNGIVLVYLTGYVCIFIPLTLFSRFKRIP